MSKKLFAGICSMACMLASVQASAAKAGEGAEALTGFVGNWRCHSGSGVAEGSDDLAIISTERMPGDWFVSWVLAFHGGDSAKKVVKLRFDEARNRYMLFMFGEDGSYGYGVADGIKDDGLAFKGEAYGADGKDTKFTKTFQKSEDGFTVTWSTDSGEEHTFKCAH